MNIQTTLPYLMAVLFVIIAVLWIQAYVRRYFRFVASKEYRYMDPNTVIVVGDYVRLYLFLFALIICVFILSLSSQIFRVLWLFIAEYFPSGIAMLTVVAVATIILQVAKRYTEYITGELHIKPRTLASKKNAQLIYLLIKYTVIIITVLLVLVIALTMIGKKETVFAAFSEFFTLNAIYIAMMIIIVIVVFVVDEGIGMFLEDFKTHTTTFAPQIISLIRGGLQYGLYSLAWLLIIYVLLMMVKMESMGSIVLAIYFVIIIFILIVFIATTIRHASAGIVLMATNPFSTGDNIKVGEVEGEVVETNIFVTKVKDVHEEILTIPNARLINQTIHNFSRVKKFGISIKVELDFEIPHAKVAEILKNAAKNTLGVVKEPEPFVRSIEIRGKKILYELVAFTKGNSDEEIVRSNLINSVQDAILSSGINNAFAVDGNGRAGK
ncbi:MAG: mechanosensitive ion channel domain-containing protein [Thermoplasmata archaeon]